MAERRRSTWDSVASQVIADGTSGSGSVNRAVVAEIAGVMAATEFSELPDAVAALLKEIEQVTLWGWHRECIEMCLSGDGAAGVIELGLARYGSWSVDLYIGEWPGSSRHAITIRPSPATGCPPSGWCSV